MVRFFLASQQPKIEEENNADPSMKNYPSNPENQNGISRPLRRDDDDA